MKFIHGVLDFEDQLGQLEADQTVQVIEFRELPGQKFYLESDPHEVLGQGDALESDELGIFGTISKIARAPISIARRVATPLTTSVGRAVGGVIGGRKGSQIGARMGRGVGQIGGTLVGASPLTALSPTLAPALGIAAAAPAVGRALKQSLGPLVKRAGAQPVADAISARAVRRVATPGCPEPHLARVSSDISRRLMPPLKRMEHELSFARTQREATSEHRSLMGRKGFRREVLERLRRIEARLPPNHPAQAKVRKAINRQLTLGRRAVDLGYR